MSRRARELPGGLSVLDMLKGTLILAVMAGVVLPLSGCAGAASESARVPIATDVFISSRGAAVPATWVRPGGGAADAPVPLVLLIHGHGGTRHEAGSFTRVAEQLARAGIASIRMDFPGCGDSTEPWYRNNLTNMLADVRAARAYAMSRANIDPTRVGLVGFSMGGRLATLLAEADGDAAAMVLWAAAVANGASEVVKMLGGPERYAAMKATAQADGYAPFTTFWGQEQQLGPEWFADMEASRPLDAVAAYPGALLLVHGSADDVVPASISYEARDAAVSARSVELLVIEGADHGFGLFSEEDRYSAELVARTVAFLTSELAPPLVDDSVAATP